MSDHSFDLVSKVDFQEVENAVNQALKEILHRYDLKDSDSTIELKQNDSIIHLTSIDSYKIRAILDILKQKLIKRNLSTKAFTENDVEHISGGRAKQTIAIQQGISTDHAKQIIKNIKQEKFNAQANIQGEQVRISSKKKDTLQNIIQFIKKKHYPFHVGFSNYR